VTRVTVRSLPTASTRRGLDERATAYLFVAPAVTTLLLVVLYPFASAVWISFQDKDLAAPGRFVGFANYVELWNQSGFARVVRNTALYVGAAVAAKFVLGLAAALALSVERRASGLYRTILFVPWALPTVVVALDWRWVYDDFSGLLNGLLSLAGMEEPISWLSDPRFAMASVVAVVVWQGTPFWTMSFLAALQAIPKELYEAARIDGATRVNEFRYVTLPQLRSVALITTMLSVIWTATDLVAVHVLTNGAPADRTQIVPNLAFETAIRGGRLGFGSAINMVFFPLWGLLIVLMTRAVLDPRADA
jgi:multiple sugar transport system permease protein